MLTIGDNNFESRLITGTGKFANSKVMIEAIKASGCQLTTMALKRVDINDQQDDILRPLIQAGVGLLPNTSGAKNSQDAVFAAGLAREALKTNWIKLEIHPDPKYLLPDPIETLKAAEKLVKQGFIVLPYCHADPVLCKRLEEVGCAAVMPLAAPIGSNKGIVTKEFIQIIVDQARVPVIVDAGIGAPSDAAKAMEMGVDAVIVNTAIAAARDPVAMAKAFKLAVSAGRLAYTAGLASTANQAMPSSPLTSFLDQVI